MIGGNIDRREQSDDVGDVYALSEIAPGQELLEVREMGYIWRPHNIFQDYGTYEHPQWFYDLHDQFGAPHEYFGKQPSALHS